MSFTTAGKFFQVGFGPLVITYSGAASGTWNFMKDGPNLYLPTIGSYTFTYNRVGRLLVKGISAGGRGDDGRLNSIYASGGRGGGGGAAHTTGISLIVVPSYTYAGRVGAGGGNVNTEFQIQSSTFYLQLTSGANGSGTGAGGTVAVGAGGVAGGAGGAGGDPYASGGQNGSSGAAGGGGGGGADTYPSAGSGGASTISGTNVSGSNGAKGTGSEPYVGNGGTGGSGVLVNGVYYGGGGGGGGAARSPDGTVGAGGAGKQGILWFTLNE